jgi:prepilin-type N-terminal cleavage/methylation domain-containing protein
VIMNGPMVKNSLDNGFTLMEVTIALAVLASAMIILLGLQSSMVDRTVIQRQQVEALRFARGILSAVEARETAGVALDIGSFSGTPNDVMESILKGSSLQNQSDSGGLRDQVTRNMTAVLNVQYWGIPSVNDKAMKRVELKLSWGDRREENLQYLFFIPFDEDDVSKEVNDDLN